MPARMIVAEGPLAGGELWIEYEVARLGSDAGCELCLDDPSLDPHAATIRYSDKRYTVYNRSGAPLQIDALIVAPGESGHWKSGTSMFFAGGTVLTLETSGDGAPARRAAVPLAPPSMISAVAADDALVAAPGSATEAEAAPKKSNANAAVVAVVFILIAVGIILSGGDQGAAKSTGPKVPTLAELLPKLQATPDIGPDLWVRLSETYASSYRGDRKAAQREFRALRDRIDWEKNALLSQGKPLPDALLDAERYVKSRMADG